MLSLKTLKSLLGIETFDPVADQKRIKSLKTLKSLLGIETFGLDRQILEVWFKNTKIPIRD